MARPWRNPLKSLSRKHRDSIQLKCKQCGACCPPACEEFSVKRGKASCAGNEKAGSHWQCDLSPEAVLVKKMVFNRGHGKNGRAISNQRVGRVEAIYNCKACQALVDKLFGKGKYDMAKMIEIPKYNQYFAIMVEAVLRAKTQVEFEAVKQNLERNIGLAKVK